MKLLDIIDNTFVWLLHKPLQLLCGLTGRSNFFWARSVLLIGCALLTTPCFNLALRTRSPFIAGMCVPVVAMSFLFYLFFASLYSEIEQRMGAQGDTYAQVPLTERQWSTLSALRCMILLPAVLAILMPGSLIGKIGTVLGILLLDISLYFATDFHPPRRSWLRRTVDKLKALVRRLSQPAITPSPAGA